MLNINQVKSLTLPNIGLLDISDNKYVSGNQIGDVPTKYRVPDMKRHEKLVIGTYIDGNIVPGFRYTVRRNDSDEYLFEGNSRVLESIGQGYGKRLTFQSDDILNNNNFFWSDSNFEDGFAFAIDVLQAGSVFNVFEQDKKVGLINVVSVAGNQEILASQNNPLTEEHEKKVIVKFNCKLQKDNEVTHHNDVLGILSMSKHKYQQNAVIKEFYSYFTREQIAYTLKQC